MLRFLISRGFPLTLPASLRSCSRLTAESSAGGNGRGAGECTSLGAVGFRIGRGIETLVCSRRSISSFESAAGGGGGGESTGGGGVLGPSTV